MSQAITFAVDFRGMCKPWCIRAATAAHAAGLSSIECRHCHRVLERSADGIWIVAEVEPVPS